MTAHTCHARGCDARTPPKLFMCARHWRMVPKHMQDAIWANYQPGQERGQAWPSDAYLDATREARRVVMEAEREGR
jgi:hypothetical protein